ncbi:hypothetical protein FA048_00430 [Pedobacter polaris]|uniref:Uncharacterized protein n=1 Tax=Pedobacter polaris TaxID=2571273 RepID=A0A4U1CXH4_9SPHI|nr:hypothetical protein [Pedobacter polaris]TKC12119.1 hypothetical protein FA048_00430 [Pedobacter polaris]
MNITLITNTARQLYRTINFCILLVTIIWSLVFALQLLNSPITELLTFYLLLFSVPVFIIGIISTVVVLMINKSVIISELQVQQLILNIEKSDYQNGIFTKIRPRNNYITVQNRYYKINSNEALMLLEISKDTGIEVKLKQWQFIDLNQSPKALFDDSMGLLWGSS